MSFYEQAYVTERLDKFAIAENDLINVFPMSGKKFNCKLNRTHIEFISEDRLRFVNCQIYKTLAAMKNESFHVSIKSCEILGKNGSLKQRYMVEVLHGVPVKLNGSYIFKAYLEDNDLLEIGYNRLIFRKKREFRKYCRQNELLRANHKVVCSQLPLLIEGETGVGKSSLAYKIHQNSKREGKFIHLNLASFSPGLIESELFGHIKGAFTGALQDKKGAFREAHGGTLFLDEIDSLPLNIQTKLLLFFDNQKIRAVGGLHESQVEARLVLSSGQNLLRLVEKGLMRQDFYFRLTCGHLFKLPALRNQPNLIKEFCDHFSLEKNISLSEKLMEFYLSLPWPGNFRQLKGHLERKNVTSKSPKWDFDAIDEELISRSSQLERIDEEVQTLKELKACYAKKVFYQFGGNYTQAAKKLGISARSLKSMMDLNGSS